MKKVLVIFLSVALSLCAILCNSFAEGPISMLSIGTLMDPGLSSDETVQTDESAVQAESADEIGRDYLKIGDASIQVMDMDYSPAEGLLYITFLYQNNSPEEHIYSDLFWISVFQNGSELNWDYENGISRLSITALANGEAHNVILTYPTADRETAIRIIIEGKAETLLDPLTLWYDPLAAAWGTWEELELTDDRLTKEPEAPVELPESRAPGYTLGNVGDNSPPREEEFSRLLEAYLSFSDGNRKLVPDGTRELSMKRAGQYTLTLESVTPIEGISSLGISVSNHKLFDRTDPTNLEGRSIRIDEIQVDGQPIPFGKGPTTYRLTTIERTGEITNRTLYTCLYSSNSEFNPDKYEDYYFWDGDTLTIPELVLVDPENFTLSKRCR